MADALSKSDKESLFKNHIENLNQRKKEQFRKLLDETHEVLALQLLLMWTIYSVYSS